MVKTDVRCAKCGESLADENVTFHAEGKNYCSECMPKHLESEDSVPWAGRTPEERRAWTYKSR